MVGTSLTRRDAQGTVMAWSLLYFSCNFLETPLQPSKRGQQKSLPTIVCLSISFSDTHLWAGWPWDCALSPPSCSLVFSLLLLVLCGFLFTCQEPLSPPYYKFLSCFVPPDLPFLCHLTSPFTPA